MSRASTQDHVRRSAFAHYLRTGQRLTNAEWLAAQERKFNPYHDARGRFTSPPGVTVSWGKYGPAGRERDSTRGTTLRSSHGKSAPRSAPPPEGRAASRGQSASSAPSLRSAFVRNATVQAGHAESYFELNKRQASLDRLRQAAGPNPAAPVKADLDEIQRRFDADRARLDARRPIIDAQTTELLRAGLAPVDVGAGAINIANSTGKLRDYLSVAGALPIGAIIRRTNGIIQLGGAQSVVKRLIRAEKISGIEVHHVPSKASLKLARIDMPPSKTPVIAQLVDDHRATRSWGSAAKSEQFRREVAELLRRGDVEAALRMEFDDLAQIRGGAYGNGTEDVARYIHDHLGKFKKAAR